MVSERRDGSGRIKLNQHAVLRNSDGVGIEVVLQDLSANGFRIGHNGEDLVIGELVTITSARGTTAFGQIKWADRNEAGGIFLDQPDAFD